MSKDRSLFEIFGPIMIGPSSSHTAGVASIAWLSRKMYGSVPERVKIHFYGSLAATAKGHGSVNAAIAGLLEIAPEDERLSRGSSILEDMQKKGQGFELEIDFSNDLPSSWHPNSMILELVSKESRLDIRASSIGGGSICINEINGYQVDLSGELEALLVLHRDEIGVIASVTNVLAEKGINIASTTSHRKEKGQEALLVVEVDGFFPVDIAPILNELKAVINIFFVPSLQVDNEIQIR